MRTSLIVSDITGEAIHWEVIHIQKTFWYGSPFDTGYLSIDTTWSELEELFGRKIERKMTKRCFCPLCKSNLLTPSMCDDWLYATSISGFMEELRDQTLTIELSDKKGAYELDLCEICWKKYFETYIRFEWDY